MKIEDLDKYISALKQCAREHEKDFIPTFNINTSNLCDDTAKMLEEIKDILIHKNDILISYLYERDYMYADMQKKGAFNLDQSLNNAYVGARNEIRNIIEYIKEIKND